MATLHHTANGTAYLLITHDELAVYTHNVHPICDECLMSLSGEEEITLVPVLNMTYCARCARAVLASIGTLSDYDRTIEQRCTEAYLTAFGQMEKPADCTREPK